MYTVSNQIYFSLKMSMEPSEEMEDVPWVDHQVPGTFFAESFIKK